jgi:hypothetical protein
MPVIPTPTLMLEKHYVHAAEHCAAEDAKEI